MNQNFYKLLEYIQFVRRLWRSRRIMEGIVLTATTFMAISVLFTALDQLVDFGKLIRWALFLLLWFVLFITVYRKIIMPTIYKHSDDFFAALIEERIPHFGNRLINALQLGREPSPLTPKLVEAIVADGVYAASEVDPDPS